MRIVREKDVHYDADWWRLEDYVKLFAEQNPSSAVKLVKDAENRFLRCFVGFGPGLNILKQCGLDIYYLDACFTKHHIVKGMQLHLVIGRNGNNRSIYLGISLDCSETNESYEFLAANLKDMGFGELVDIEPGPLNRVPVSRWVGGNMQLARATRTHSHIPRTPTHASFTQLKVGRIQGHEALFEYFLQDEAHAVFQAPPKRHPRRHQEAQGYGCGAFRQSRLPLLPDSSCCARDHRPREGRGHAETQHQLPARGQPPQSHPGEDVVHA